MKIAIAEEGHPGYKIFHDEPYFKVEIGYAVLQQCNFHHSRKIEFYGTDRVSGTGRVEVALFKIHPTNLPIRDRMWARGFMEFYNGETGKTKFIATVIP